MKRFFQEMKNEEVSLTTGSTATRTFDFGSPRLGNAWFVEACCVGDGESHSQVESAFTPSQQSTSGQLQIVSPTGDVLVMSTAEYFRKHAVLPISNPIMVTPDQELRVFIRLRNDSGVTKEMDFEARLQLVEVSDEELSMGFPYATTPTDLS